MNSNKIIIYFILSAIFLSGTIAMTAHAASVHAASIQEPLMFFCANNPISKKYNVDGITAGNIMGGCKEKLDGYSWGSRIYILIYAPGWNTDSDKLDVIGNNKHNPITANSREGNMSLEGDGCNGFIETAPDHGLFYGSIKLSGFRHDVNGDGRPDLYGGNRCEQNTSSVLDDGSGRVEAKQEGAVTVNFEYSEEKFVSKTALHSWREATLEFDKTEYDVSDEIQLTLTDLDNMRWPFDKKQPYEIHVYSDSDSAGILMDAYWVPNYKGIVQMNGYYPIKLNLTFDDEILLNNLLKKGSGKGLWPGLWGFFDSHELPEDALHQTLRELNLRMESVSFLESFRHQLSHINYLVQPVKVHVSPPSAQAESSGIKWINLADFSQLPISVPVRKIIDSLR